MTLRRLTALTLAILVGASAAGAYVLNGPKWGIRQIPYYINPVNSDMSESEAIAAIQSAALAWTSQSNADIMLSYAGRTSGASLTKNGRNEVFFRDTSAGGLAADTYWWYDGSYQLVEADVVFYDGGIKFFSSNSLLCLGGLYLEDVAIHELGHALGLGHSSVPTATMYGAIPWCTTAFRSLDSDDLAGIEAMYPASGSTNSAPTLSVSSPLSGTSVLENVLVSFVASATDKEDGNLSNHIHWFSSRDGYLGTGAALLRVLSVGSHTIRATVSDSRGLEATRDHTVSVTSAVSTPPAPAPPPPTGENPAISLAARGFKVKGYQRVSLQWSGASASVLTVIRDGVPVMSVANDGSETDLLNRKGPGTYTYQVCESGTVCSNVVVVSF